MTKFKANSRSTDLSAYSSRRVLACNLVGLTLFTVCAGRRGSDAIRRSQELLQGMRRPLALPFLGLLAVRQALQPLKVRQQCSREGLRCLILSRGGRVQSDSLTRHGPGA